MHEPGFCINRQRVQSGVAAGIQGPSSDGSKGWGMWGGVNVSRFLSKRMWKDRKRESWEDRRDS